MQEEEGTKCIAWRLTVDFPETLLMGEEFRNGEIRSHSRGISLWDNVRSRNISILALPDRLYRIP